MSGFGDKILIKYLILLIFILSSLGNADVENRFTVHGNITFSNFSLNQSNIVEAEKSGNASNKLEVFGEAKGTGLSLEQQNINKTNDAGDLGSYNQYIIACLGMTGAIIAAIIAARFSKKQK